MHIYKLFIEYNGKNFSGSQRQSLTADKSGSLRTVQGVLENILSQLLKSKFKLKLASRTDAGVHALCNVGKLVCEESIDREQFLAKLNFLLPDDLKVVDILETEDFNPYNAKSKVYYYTIYNSEHNAPTIFTEYCWYVPKKISMSKLRCAAKFISSQKKFDFVTTKDYIEDKQNTRCNIKISISKINRFIIIKFKGKRFTHRMIRNIVALLIEVATGKIRFEDLKRIVSSWGYCRLKPAPAKGLILVNVTF